MEGVREVMEVVVERKVEVVVERKVEEGVGAAAAP